MDWIHQDLPNFQFVYVSGILLFHEIFNYELWTMYLLELVFSKFKIFNNTLNFDKHPYTYVCVHAGPFQVFLPLEYFLVSHK